MSDKDLNYFKTLNYNIVVEGIHAEGETFFIAYTNEFGKYACFGKGETPSEALSEFLNEKEVFIEYLFNANKNIPEPQCVDFENFGGVFNVRTTPVIHSQLVSQAKELNVSLNLYLNQIISAAVERRKNESLIMEKLLEISTKIDSNHFEITNQLKYNRDSSAEVPQWKNDYCTSPYLKIA